ncbi:MAG: hypothetical protein HQM09_22480 [Candidatus Riflebacteria bacterium]|nr:hypothetical protein [Candidatus Riflebacteria bacterium]
MPIIAFSAYSISPSDEKFLDQIQRETFKYFVECANPENGIVLDRADNFSVPDFQKIPGSIAGVGFGLTSLAIGAERNWIAKDEARRRTINTLEFFANKAERKNGFYYHFLDATTGKRSGNCEISSVDTALLMAGVLFAGKYYNDPQIARLSRIIFNRVDWRWMKNGTEFLCMGWKPEEGFLSNYWTQYAESLLMYILAMGSTTNGIDPTSWKNLKRIVGIYGGRECIYCPSLFTHQYSHIWIDFRDKYDGFADYFENSIQATLINRQYCLDSRRSFKTFDDDCWGLTASIGPDGYCAYGSPPGPAQNDGTVAPSAAGGSIVFTPELSIRVLKHIFREYHKQMWGRYGFSDSMNLDKGFFASDTYAINQGPILLMIENLRSEFVWKTFMRVPEIKRGMMRAGFVDENGGSISLKPEIYPKQTKSIDAAHLAPTLPRFQYKCYLPHEKPVMYVEKIPDSTSFSDLSCTNSRSADLWKKAKPGICLDQSFLQFGSNYQKDYQCKAVFLHNSNFLFIKISLHDSELVVQSPSEKMYQDDSVEIFLDSESNGLVWSGKKDYQIIVSPSADLKSLRVREFFNQVQSDKILSQFKKSKSRHVSSYEFVLGIPKREFNLIGSKTGFSLAAHNIDLVGRSDAKFNWFFLEPGIQLGSLIFENTNEQNAKFK